MVKNLKKIDISSSGNNRFAWNQRLIPLSGSKFSTLAPTNLTIADWDRPNALSFKV